MVLNGFDSLILKGETGIRQQRQMCCGLFSSILNLRSQSQDYSFSKGFLGFRKIAMDERMLRAKLLHRFVDGKVCGS